MSETYEQFPVSSTCVFCQVHVRPSRHALQCSLCGQWQHRVCHKGNKSGVTHEDYLDLVEGRIVFTWQCVLCPQPGRQIADTITSEIDGTILLDEDFAEDNAIENTHNVTMLDSTGNDTKELSEDEIIELEQSNNKTIQLAEPEDRTNELEQIEKGTIELEMTENIVFGLEMSGNGNILLEQLEVVGDTFILEQQDLVPKESVSFLEQSEDADNTLVFEPPLQPHDGILNSSNLSEVEKSVNQDEMSTILFPHDATTPLVDTKSVIDIATPSHLKLKAIVPSSVLSLCSLGGQTPSMKDDPARHMDGTAVLRNISVGSDSFNSISFNQSTPITLNRLSRKRRRAASFLRRVSAITVTVPSPERDLQLSSIGLTLNSPAISPINYSLLYKQVTRNKRCLSNENRSPASKKRIIENV